MAKATTVDQQAAATATARYNVLYRITRVEVVDGKKVRKVYRKGSKLQLTAAEAKPLLDAKAIAAAK